MPCSICKQPGHNRRSCPRATASTTSSSRPKSMAKTFVSDDNDCCICMNPIQTTNRCTTKCGHNFCLSCFFECSVHKSECPICRTKFNYSISGQLDKLKREYAELAKWTRALEGYDMSNFRKIRALEKTIAEKEQVIRRQHNNLELKGEVIARLYDENHQLNMQIRTIKAKVMGAFDE